MDAETTELVVLISAYVPVLVVSVLAGWWWLFWATVAVWLLYGVSKAVEDYRGK